MKLLIGSAAAVAFVFAFGQSAMASSAGDWAGPYVGAYAGPNQSSGHATTTTVYSGVGYFAASSVTAIGVAGNQSMDGSGPSVGLLGGYNFALDDHWLAGLEVDFGVNQVDETSAAGNAYPCCAPTAFVVQSRVQTNWLLTARPRVGYVWDDWQAYVTGGLAMTNEKASFLFTDTYAAAHESGVFKSNKASWTIGGGIERRLDEDVTVRLEYLYADFGGVGGTSANLTAYTPAIAYPVNVFTHRATLNENLVRFAVTVHV